MDIEYFLRQVLKSDNRKSEISGNVNHVDYFRVP
jgi:hypothetical protein